MGFNFANNEGTVGGSDWTFNLDAHDSIKLWLQETTDGSPVFIACVTHMVVGMEVLIYSALSHQRASCIHEAKDWWERWKTRGNGDDPPESGSPVPRPPRYPGHPEMTIRN